MARQLRIEYPGAFHHIFSRGNQKQPIFLADDDRHFFLKCLREASKKFGVIIHVYCLMPNHFHLILETPLGNLSRMMHSLITGYTIYFNKKHKRHGHLFQGRFKSILIEAVSYAKELSRYIHLNPVRAGLVERPESYAWSSYEYYRGMSMPARWLETSVVLRLFGEQLKESKKAYVEFVMHGIGEEAPASIKDSMRTGVLGSEEFIARIKREYLEDELVIPDREKPQLRRLRDKPDLHRILLLAGKALGPGNRWTIPIAILISHTCTASRLKDLGEFFSLSVSGVSNACSRARAAIANNAALARTVLEVEREIAREAQREGQTYLLPKNG